MSVNSQADHSNRADATAGWSKELTDAATGLIWPLFSEVQTSKEWIEYLGAKVV